MQIQITLLRCAMAALLFGVMSATVAAQGIGKKQLKAGLASGSKLVELTGNSTTERTVEGTFVFKEYYYDTGILTISHSYSDADCTIPHGLWRDYSDEGVLRREGRFINGKRQGEWKEYNHEAKTTTTLRYVDDMGEGLEVTVDAEGRKRRETPYVAGKRQGIERTYNEDGTLKREYRYVDDQLQEDPSASGEFALKDIEIPPRFPCHPQVVAAGITDEAACSERSLLYYLSSNINYPHEMRENYVMGRAMATFVVDKDGAVTDINVIHGISDDIKREVIRVLKKMPAWTPGKAGDHPVKVRYTLPVGFRLE